MPIPRNSRATWQTLLRNLYNEAPMLTHNSQGPRDVFAMELVKNHGVTLRQLQVALERAAEEDMSLDVVLFQMKAASQAALASAATAADYVLTAEQPATPRMVSNREQSILTHTTRPPHVCDTKTNTKDYQYEYEPTAEYVIHALERVGHRCTGSCRWCVSLWHMPRTSKSGLLVLLAIGRHCSV